MGVFNWFMVNPVDVIEEMKQIKAPMGVYAVMGNHDYWWDGGKIKKLLEDTDIKLLTDEALLVKHNNSAFWVVGLDDMVSQHSYSLKNALSKTDQDVPTILLSHSPDVFPLIPDNVELTLSGHTHGGQVYIPFIGRPIVPLDNKQYALGHFKEGHKQLFVTSGIGTSILPIRFMTPPEIVVMYLKPEK